MLGVSVYCILIGHCGIAVREIPAAFMSFVSVQTGQTYMYADAG